MAQLMAAPESVIEPCTKLIDDKSLTLTNLQRAEALFVRGRGFHRTKRLNEAVRDYSAATALAPDNVDIWLDWAAAEVRLGNGQRYFENVKRAVKLDQGRPRVIRFVGAMYWDSGRYDEAMELYTKALRVDPQEPFALFFRSRGYRNLHKFPEAIADADAMVAVPREVGNLEGYLDTDGTARDFHVAALVYRGKLFEQTGQNDRAIQDFDAAVADGRSAFALVAKANFLLDLRKLSPEAVALLTEATKKEPRNELAQYSLGLAFTYAKDFKSAFGAFDQAIMADPQSARALQMRARMHRQFGETEEAVKDFVAAIEIDPDTLTDAMPALRHAGYWTSGKNPEEFTPELQDAIRACMLDTTCN